MNVMIIVIKPGPESKGWDVRCATVHACPRGEGTILWLTSNPRKAAASSDGSTSAPHPHRTLGSPAHTHLHWNTHILSGIHTSLFLQSHRHSCTIVPSHPGPFGPTADVRAHGPRLLCGDDLLREAGTRSDNSSAVPAFLSSSHVSRLVYLNVTCPDDTARQHVTIQTGRNRPLHLPL
jgi:hypothetical protein